MCETVNNTFNVCYTPMFMTRCECKSANCIRDPKEKEKLQLVNIQESICTPLKPDKIKILNKKATILGTVGATGSHPRGIKESQS